MICTFVQFVCHMIIMIISNANVEHMRAADIGFPTVYRGAIEK